MPASRDHGEHRAEETSQESSAGQQQIEVFIAVGRAGFHAAEGPVDGEQDDEVHEGDGEKEQCGDKRSDHAADAVDGVELTLEGGRCRSDGEGRQHDDCRVSEGEEEADCRGALTLLHQFAGDVVDGGDMIGVDGMAEAEGVRQQCGAEQHRMVAEGGQSPGPGGEIGDEQNGVDTGNLDAEIADVVAEDSGENAPHLFVPTSAVHHTMCPISMTSTCVHRGRPHAALHDHHR